MFNKIRSLVWLRTNMLQTNKNLLIQILMPYVLCLCYKKFMNMDDQGSISIVFMCLAMSFSFSIGNMISNTISEEKEKNNLKTLILSGVTGTEYIFATLFYPIIFGITSIVILPILAGADLDQQYFSYIVISILTAIAVVLINLLVGIFSETQSKAQINSLPIMFITTLLPMFTTANETLATINEYSFMGSYTGFFANLKSSPFGEKSFVILVVWILVLFVANMIVFKTNKSGLSFSKISKNSENRWVLKTNKS